MKKYLDIIYKVAYGLFFAFIALIVVVLIMSRTSFNFGVEVLVVQSGSMEPEIHTGSVVIIKSAEEYKLNDIITFGRSRRTPVPTTHRIVEIKNDNGEISYATKGDANSSTDMSDVKHEKVIGKVMFSVPYFGYIVDMAKKPWGFAAIIGLPALIIIGDEVKKIIIEIKKRKSNVSEDDQDEEKESLKKD